MSMLRRISAVALAAPAIVLAGHSAAMADASFADERASAGPGGATLTVVRSHADDDGGVTHKTVTYTAGPEGASVDSIRSAAD